MNKIKIMLCVYLHEFRHYANFKGRASIEYYRSFMRIYGIIFFCLMGLAEYSDEKVFVEILVIYFFISLLPMLAVMARRLHDLGKSGWNTIDISTSYLIRLSDKEGSPEPNKYGEKPNDMEFIKIKKQL
ncbi:DUF805 domain-containing protein [Pasteurella skyensis]|uniref:DUF805 domain-containing protein n=1 Tax=Phocoenobacter skyensis TaxID=97481 RepID=A0AAJ6N8F7_9PAST|nr:DUF805 domain-containing protein [Pasteurella skyensis]MDP8161978.1 DUF805 domain-containing protein [Pasteurella skyensis]MDP8172134.1 DUF805 domain-containing protein [Pasteurella skyensis]MDP8176518.1 DUF805 domain-containing protein [Pasteurella skyensis]MDP8178406.1 DUF805 domain-containing protein [Pasteurella skyensis]MDP8182838.1 DUF805 domain-containing protein [Pasteurella skyensis]